MKHDKSLELYLKYRKITPGGVQSNFRFDYPHPLYFSRGKGAFVFDVDGNSYIDLIVGYGSVILGHNDPDVNAFVKEIIDAGLISGYETELNYEVASMIHEMVPSAKMVRFANSGTEAVMHAIQLARSFTGKRKILKFEGCYHGWYDYVAYSHNPPLDLIKEGAVAWPDFDGISPTSANDVVVVRYNDVDSTQRKIRELKDELAAVIVEPACFNMGCVLTCNDFLRVLREETEKYSIPLIFDEVITGFRISLGGAQEYYGVIPDLTTLGKAIANGYPLSAVVGREDIMEIAAPGKKSTYAGTFNGNQIALAAAKVTLMKLRSGRIQEYFAEKTKYLQKKVKEASEEAGILVFLSGIGGQFQIYFSDKDVVDYPSAASADKNRYNVFREYLKSKGVLMHPSYLFHHGITYAHTDDIIEDLAAKIKETILHVSKSVRGMK